MRFTTILLLLAASLECTAGPALGPGDLGIRHDIRLLADHGVIRGPVSSWPLSWGSVLADLQRVRRDYEFPVEVRDAIARILAKGEWESVTGSARVSTRVSVAGNPSRLRFFQDTPREEGEVGAGVSWTGERISLNLEASLVSNPQDGDTVRADGSHIAVAVGNWTLAAGAVDRWWGPGWDSSLVLSSNARPIPAITLDRRHNDAFTSKWLSWFGTWDLSLVSGWLEEDREIPNARWLGIRFDFRPFPSLEIGISRTALWCGDGRPCDLQTLGNLLIGRDNRGDEGITIDNEPGDQTAALDFRWSAHGRGLPVAVYGQFMAEDEAGGFPSRYMGQAGIDGSGIFRDRWSYRWYLEAAATSCDFWKTEERFDCAYNHFIYKTGYRYKGRVIGHSADNDARIVTAGLVLVGQQENSWIGQVRTGRLNRGGFPGNANSVSQGPQDFTGVDLVHNRVFRFGRIELGLGYDRFGGNMEVPSSNDVRAFIQWRSDY